MGKILLDVLFKTIYGVVNMILFPVNALVVNLFPDFSALLTALSTAIQTFINSTFTWFIYILPPITKTALIIYITFLITYYTISITLHYILKVFQIIKNIKFW